MSQFHKLSIKDIQKETDKAVSITFDVPEDLKETYAFKAGQYITLKTIINTNEVRRDYSLCSSPKSGELKIAVKEVKDGTFSAYANNNLQIGEALEVAPPKGRFVFTPEENASRTIAAFAAGSGITPVLSIIKSVLEDCYRLDQIGFDHGELSNISKHVIVGKSKVSIIDFESSSTKRKPSNVTSITQAFFIGSGIARTAQKIYKNSSKEKIIDALKLYKQEKTRVNFDNLLKVLKL